MDNQQSAELICQKIRDDANSQADSILRKAKQNAGLRIKLAKAEANKYLEQKKEEAKGKTADIRKRSFSTVGLETRRIIAKAREELIAEVLEEVKIKGKNFRQQLEYPGWLKSIIIEGLLNIAQNQVHPVRNIEDSIPERKISNGVKVVASGLDSKIIEKDFVSDIKNELKKNHNLDVGIETVFDKNIRDAGVYIKSRDERIIFRNTFLARMERQKNQLRLLIFKEIFGNA